ncbi:MAG: ABC transporter permease [Microthrixaceae bacterium]|nr:ABC transporter permease [Microthrixaceae bacterium]
MTAASIPQPSRYGPLSQLWALLHLEALLARRLAPLRLAMAFVPLVMMVFLAEAVEFLVKIDGYRRSNGTEHGIPGLAVLFCYVNLPFFCWSAYDEHGFGTWDRLRSGLVRPPLILASKVLFMASYLVVIFVLSYSGGLALDMEPNGSRLGWVVTALLTSLVAALYGLMLYVLLPTGNLFIIISHAGCLVMGGFAGALVPFRLLPGWVQAIAPILPQYWSVRAFREVSLDGRDFTSILSELLVLCCFGLVFASVAAWRFDPEALKRPLSE